jgi:pimeloyl-ACP methyl ester carboxylesterase
VQLLPTSLRSLPPIWRESTLPAEAASLMVDPIFRGRGMPAGHGRPVLLIPGYLAGDTSLRPMSGWLQRGGYRAERAGIRLNVGCGGATIDRLEARLEALSAATGNRRVVLVGQSRGGAHARALAGRRPELVSGVVTLGAPLIDPLMVHPLVRANVEVVGRLGSLGVPGLLQMGCRDGACCEPLREGLRTPLPDEVGYVSIYSRRDGIVDWHACLDEGAEHVEVDASHLGMGLHAETYRQIAAALRRFRDAELESEAAGRVGPLAAAA